MQLLFSSFRHGLGPWAKRIDKSVIQLSASWTKSLPSQSPPRITQPRYLSLKEPSRLKSTKLPNSSLDSTHSTIPAAGHGKLTACSALMENGVKVLYLDNELESQRSLEQVLLDLKGISCQVLQQGSDVLVVWRPRLKKAGSCLCASPLPASFFNFFQRETPFALSAFQLTPIQDGAWTYYATGKPTMQITKPSDFGNRLKKASECFLGQMKENHLCLPEDPKRLMNLLWKDEYDALTEKSHNRDSRLDQLFAEKYQGNVNNYDKVIPLPWTIRSIEHGQQQSALLSDGTPVFWFSSHVSKKAYYPLQIELRVLDKFIQTLNRYRAPSQFAHALVVRFPHQKPAGVKVAQGQIAVWVFTRYAWYGLGAADDYRVFSVKDDPRNGYQYHYRRGSVPSGYVSACFAEHQIREASAKFRGQLRDHQLQSPHSGQNLHHTLPPFEAIRMWRARYVRKVAESLPMAGARAYVKSLRSRNSGHIRAEWVKPQMSSSYARRKQPDYRQRNESHFPKPQNSRTPLQRHLGGDHNSFNPQDDWPGGVSSATKSRAPVQAGADHFDVEDEMKIDWLEMLSPSKPFEEPANQPDIEDWDLERLNDISSSLIENSPQTDSSLPVPPERLYRSNNKPRTLRGSRNRRR